MSLKIKSCADPSSQTRTTLSGLFYSNATKQKYQSKRWVFIEEGRLFITADRKTRPKLSNKTFKLQENQGRALHSVWRHSAFSIGCQYVFRCECDAAHLENAGSQQKREAWDVKGKKINDEFYIFLIFLLELCGPNFATSHTGTEHIRRCITGLSKSTKARNQSRGYPTWPVTRMRTSRIEFSCFVFLTLIKKKKSFSLI